MIAETATRDGPTRTRPAIDAAAVCFGLEPLDDPAALAPRWRALEAHADASVFQSWDWIGCWLETLPAGRRPQLVTGTAAGRCVLLAALVPGRRRRLGLQPFRQAHLHESPVADERSPTIEANGPLVDRRVGPGLLDRLTGWLLDGRCDELVLPGLAAGLADAIAPGRVGRRLDVVAPYVDLAALRAAGMPYLASRSANTRAQLRRALRRYGGADPVLETAGTVGEALDWLARLEALHQARWVARGQPGAFASPFFRAFHRRLVATGVARGTVRLQRLRAGERVLGYLYNLAREGCISAYQTGFEADPDKAAKPAMVAHWLAIDAAAGAARRYEFLAGLNQLKQSLATQAESMSWLTCRRPDWMAFAEDWARCLKSRLK